MTKKEKPFFSFTVSDGSGQLRLSYFTRKATLEKVRALKAGDSVCFTGDMELFNGSLSFRPKAVDYGTPPKDYVFEERPSRPAPPRYTAVFPEPCEDLVQGMLFGETRLPAGFEQGRYVVFDLETTGLNNNPVAGPMDRIIEVGAVKIEGGEIREKAAQYREERGREIGLAVVLVGDNPASQVYVNTKVRKCAELGIYSEKIVLPKETTQAELLAVIDKLNRNPTIHGILVQSPPPPQIDEEQIILSIDPRKDVDCFHPFNAGKMLQGDMTGFLPCTPWGVMKLLEYYKIALSGKRAVVLGRSNIVGKPMMCMLSNKGVDATVTLCHSRTANLAEELRRADLIVAAIGKPEFVRGDMVKEGAVVIDVGINRVADAGRPKGYRLTGDVAFEEVAPKASAITPVPGGVGPMTIAMLMRNTLRGMERIMEAQ